MNSHASLTQTESIREQIQQLKGALKALELSIIYDRHPSLKETAKLKPFPKTIPKPLVDSEEISEMARKAILEQVEKRIKELTVEQTSFEQINTSLNEIKQVLKENQEANEKNLQIEYEVLTKLKAKLEQ